MDLPDEIKGKGLSRRQALRLFGMAGAGALVSRPAASWAASSAGTRVITKAAATKAAGSDLGAIDHIVFLMMENRSYDHYFGAYPRGRGFNDHPAHSLGAFAQDYPGGIGLVPAGKLLPFHLDSKGGEECTNDLTHEWGPMHLCWNHGKMDSFVKTHTSSTYEGAHGAMTMGHYTRADLPFYYALADNFTLCDGYHAAILGPTHPNRLMANTGTIDPHGLQGGPVTDTNSTPDVLWSCTWTTVQELLEDKGVPWKVYHPSNLGVSGKYAPLLGYPTWDPALYDPTVNPEVMTLTDHVLPYFSAFRNPLSSLYSKAFTPTFPNDFVSDVNSGSLPSVSWIIPPLGFDEHPSSSPDNGMYFTSLVLDALTANPKVWERTALFLMYDENDGWFDHVPPPTPPAGTAGEFLTATPPKLGDPDPGTLGITGPLGLGVRVPMLVISPFSRGGHIAPEVFDHTSQLRLVSERFGVAIPNVSAWRRKTVGDLTSTLFQSRTETAMPRLPVPTLAAQQLDGPCSALDQDSEFGGAGPSIPTKQRMPNQQGGSTPATEYFPTAKAKAEAISDDDRTPLAAGPGKATTKSAYNKLAQATTQPA
jgi:phospholipase C